ncbi:MAG TPA: hypothetical protein VFE13_17005 [Caulobacteraceae bacterium]|nr:hypothetical protein [Caulobacteraceae bacterium]
MEALGVPRDDISLIGAAPGRDPEGRSFAEDPSHEAAKDAAAEDAGKGAVAGGALGAAAGVLTGLGLIAIPGIGPVVAAGWLASTLTGAAVGAAAGGATGGIIGALTKNGVSEEDAHVYAEGVKRGGTLVSVRAADADTARVEQAMSHASAYDAARLGEGYRSAGWTRFDETGLGSDTRPL